MTTFHRRYVVIETTISIAINVVISIAFVWLMFGGSARIAATALIRDAVPQSFMIALMGGLVPTLLTRKRRRAGAIAGIGRPLPLLVRNLPVRVLLIAVIAAVAGLELHALLVPLLIPQGLSFGATIAFKAFYGAMLAAIVTPFMLRLALADPMNWPNKAASDYR